MWTRTSSIDLVKKHRAEKHGAFFILKYRRAPVETNRGAAIPGLAGHKESR